VRIEYPFRFRTRENRRGSKIRIKSSIE